MSTVDINKKISFASPAEQCRTQHRTSLPQVNSVKYHCHGEIEVIAHQGRKAHLAVNDRGEVVTDVLA